MRTPSTTAIAAASLRHKPLVIVAWLILALAGACTVGMAIQNMTYSYATPGQPGYQANQDLMARFGIDPTIEPTIGVLRLPPGESMRTALGQRIAAETFAAAPKAGIVAVADYATTGNPRLISADGRSTWALINMPNPDKGPGVGVVDRLGPVLTAAAPRGVSVTVTGFAQLLANGGGSRGGPSVLVETVIGAAIALIIMLLVYGSAIAVVPLLMAVPAILVTFLCVLGLTYVTDISYFLQYLVPLLGLGVAVDYSLLIVVRWRAERQRGRSNEEAILAAGEHAGKAVLLSGATVAVGLLALVVLPVPFLRSIGFGGMLIPLVALAAALTLLPVTLALCGPALDRRRIWRGSAAHSHGWERWGRLIVRRPVAAGLGGLVIVAALAVPALYINTAEPLVSSLAATGPAAQAFASLERGGIPAAVDFPIQVLSHGGAAGADRAAAIAAATPGVFAVLSPGTTEFRRGGAALLTVIPTAEGSTSAGRAIVTGLSQRLARVGAEVGGSTAGDLAFSRAVNGNLPWALALISVLTFLILARAFRSVVLALKAVLLNVVSLGSAFGFMVLFWQQGHGSSLLYGTPATAAIRDWIPIVVFACLFGLSMDYEVFLLARIREEYDRSGSTSAATVAALAHTGRLVTCAALILAASFLSLGTNPNELVRIVATALAVGVLVDALVVRTLLVPALVVLLGRWNWWMPSGLERLLGRWNWWMPSGLERLLGLTAIAIDSERPHVV
jgi:RND superfamily putative drug exporter